MIAEPVTDEEWDAFMLTHGYHVWVGEPDPECDDCAEANAATWERMMTPW